MPFPPGGEVLGRRELVVIGAGPVGIAALWFARRRGIDAIALEAAASPVATLRAFVPGLVTASHAEEWGIDGLPVDCRDRREITREDLLSYYARVAAYGGLRFACRQRVAGIRAGDDEIAVDVRTDDGPGRWLARRVIVTPWYRARRLHIPGAEEHGVEVRAPAGELPFGSAHAVVVGAGLSGLEMSDLLIRRGARVTLLSRRPRTLPADLAVLFERTGSTLLTGVSHATVPAPRVLRVERATGVTDVPCDVAFNCTGQEANGDLLDVLARDGLLAPAELGALTTCLPANLDTQDVTASAARLPRLGDALWNGRRGVHFAGTAFHVGGLYGAGIANSIQTAEWAVDAVAGASQAGCPVGEQLPLWFLAAAQRGELVERGPRWSPQLAAIVPAPVPTWSRGTKLFEGESATGSRGLGASHETRALGDARDALLTELREACYEGASVAQLAELLELDPETLVSNLRVLWYGNGLTWVPPEGGL